MGGSSILPSRTRHKNTGLHVLYFCCLCAVEKANYFAFVENRRAEPCRAATGEPGEKVLSEDEREARNLSLET